MEVKLSDFSEEMRYVIECPKCGDYLESPDDPAYDEEIYCDGCQTVLEIVDDITK